MKIRSILFTLFISLALFSYAAQVDTVSIYAQKMQKEIKTVVISPDNCAKGKSYPVIYLLHGYSGNYSNWVNKAPVVKKLADNYQLIFVCPDGGYGGWYIDSPVDPNSQYASFIAQDVVSYIDKHYATIATREGRAITGLSMGGHGGLYLGISYRDVFAHAGSMSGAVDVSDVHDKYQLKERLGKTYAEDPDLYHAYAVYHLVDVLKNKELNIIFDCGVDDFLYKDNAALHTKLKEMNIDHDYIERPGKHNWEYWNNAICYQTLFFAKHFMQITQD